MTDPADKDKDVEAVNGQPDTSGGLPEKPPGSKWTDSQWRAVVRRGRNLLVAAAAGSGKTAVLVERIIRRVSDEEDPVDVDRLLVATFTKAAAAEMRQRIGEALEKALYGLPDSVHLKRQLSLLNRASITTLHSFCMEVIRRYFHTIALDPGFRVADDTEAALIRQEELEGLLEERYGEAPEGHPFWTLADWYGGDRSDAALLALVERLYEASRSHPFPDRWLNAMAGMFRVEEAEDGRGLERFDGHPWFASLLKDVSLELDGASALLGEALALCGMPGGPAPYAANLEEELRLVSAAAAAGRKGWTDLYEAFGTVAFGRLKPVKGDSLDKELQERVKNLRSDAKEKLQKLREELFVRTPEEYLAELGRLAPVVDELCQLTVEFAERYSAAKREKGLLDFADLEHMCLAILGKPGGGNGTELEPTAAALAYREQFVEVMLDEYQDTNLVQETIVSLISRPLPGNRFIVGDVKQSIYRFRLAEPGLFLAKYREYQPGGSASGSGERIDLARNFRSRRQVVDAVNVLFRQVMRLAVAEMDYGRDEELVYGAGFAEHGSAEGLETAAGPDYAAELVLVDKSDASSGGAAGFGAGGDADAASDGEEDFSGASGSAAEADGGGGKSPWETEREELETAQLEARYIGRRIRELTGMDGGAPFPVAERDGSRRPARFRDVVILLRATRGWAPVFMEELSLMGIPAYADIDTGYFTATEVETLLSLLKVIDNPRQDIPLAAVLRSPLVGLSADELAQIRLADRQGDYYGAMEAWIRQAGDGLRDETGGSPAPSPILLPYGVPAGGTAYRETAASAADRRGTLGMLDKLDLFRQRLAVWRRDSVQGDLSALIADIYRVTGYFDYAGGLPGGVQRQANLRALYDRARQYEKTSFRGLFRFLRFVERMREGGGDLGTARTLGEQEDIVRIMSIHKSKGLEFPVVFVGGTAKGFNMMDLNGAFLIHKELGFGPRYKDEELQAVYPTLPQLAIRRRLRMETLAEEMRVLYVALTRAKEKLVLVGTVPSAAKRIEAAGGMASGDRESGKAGAEEGVKRQNGGTTASDGGEAGAEDLLLAGSQGSAASAVANGLSAAGDQPLPDYLLASARSYLDWVLPAVIKDGSVSVSGSGPWQVHTVHAETLSGLVGAAVEAADGFADKLMEAVRTLEPMPVPVPDGTLREEVSRRLAWAYPNPDAGAILTKTSVTELKRLEAKRILSITEAEEAAPGLGLYLPLQAGGDSPAAALAGHGGGGGESLLYRTPRFRKSRKLTAAETGVLYHTAMQHMPLDGSGTIPDIGGTLDKLTEAGFIGPADREVLDGQVIAAFFATDVGRRLASAKEVRRELAFTLGLEAGELYPDCAPEAAKELVLLQGIIDCLFEDRAGRLVLLDYKTDRTKDLSDRELAERYRVQLKLYERAVTDIWGRKPDELAVYFFDEKRLVQL